jgi:RNA polymerase sigma-70 factor (ECF subfamily)
MTDREPAETVAIERARAASGVRQDAALGAFVIEHYDRLLGLARLVCRDGTDAGDAVQVGLEQAWRQRASLRDPERLRPWLDRIVVREAIRLARSRRSWLVSAFGLHPAVGWVEPVDPTAEQLPAWSALRVAFAELSPEQRAVIALHLYAGYSIVETAELVGAPQETVRSRLRLAKDRLRRELKESGS